MKILIVGGGVGGLALVGCLKKVGITDITLVEKAPEFHHIGFLIGLWGNGRLVMKHLGIDNITERNGYEVKTQTLKTQNGKVLKTIPVSFGGKFKSTATIDRADLHEGLLTLIEKDTKVKFNTTIEKIYQKNDCVEITYSDQFKESFDLVVGADGIHSQVREKVFGPGFLKYYNWRVWAYWLPKNFNYPKNPLALIGNVKFMGILPSNNSSTITFIAKQDPDTLSKNLDRREEIKVNFSEFTDFAPEVISLAPTSSEIWSDNLAFVDMPLWHKGRVVLIGDAQHAVSPIVGMGSSMAMEDAFVLAEELSKSKDNIPLALDRFSKRRTSRMKKFLKQVNRMDGWTKAHGLLRWFRDFFTPLTFDSYFTGIMRKLMNEKM